MNAMPNNGDDKLIAQKKGGNRLKLSKVFMLGLLSLAILIAGCGNSPEDAKNDLKKMNLQYNEKSFLESIVNNNLKAVTLFLEAGMSANLDAKEGTPLTLAASRSQLELIKLLVEKGADVNKKDKDKMAPIMAALLGEGPEEGKLSVVKYLAEKGADLSVQYTAQGVVFTPLISAVNSGNLEMTKILLDKKADINAGEAKSGVTPLMFAVTHKDLPLAKFLLEKGADFTKKSKDGATALMVATYQKDAEMVKLLKSAGAKN